MTIKRPTTYTTPQESPSRTKVPVTGTIYGVYKYLVVQLAMILARLGKRLRVFLPFKALKRFIIAL